MSKRRTFLRRTALSLAAGAGVCAAADVATAQIILNGGTHNAHSALTDGGLNARYWTNVESGFVLATLIAQRRSSARTTLCRSARSMRR